MPRGACGGDLRLDAVHGGRERPRGTGLVAGAAEPVGVHGQAEAAAVGELDGLLAVARRRPLRGPPAPGRIPRRGASGWPRRRAGETRATGSSRGTPRRRATSSPARRPRRPRPRRTARASAGAGRAGGRPAARRCRTGRPIERGQGLGELPLPEQGPGAAEHLGQRRLFLERVGLAQDQLGLAPGGLVGRQARAGRAGAPARGRSRRRRPRPAGRRRGPARALSGPARGRAPSRRGPRPRRGGSAPGRPARPRGGGAGPSSPRPREAPARTPRRRACRRSTRRASTR